MYSVHSRLIGEWVEVRIYADYLEVWYAQKVVEKLPRLKGDYKHCIQYRHIIDWLLRKPGAFENYRYREDLFPTSRFRMAYDYLKKHRPAKATKEYLKILWLAAYETEEGVDCGLRELLYRQEAITAQSLESLIKSKRKVSSALDVQVADVDLSAYDELLDAMEDCHV